ncbi:MAG: demethoxyubiquinone hydroxylase family protein [Rickettsiaceae bacterium]
MPKPYFFDKGKKIREIIMVNHAGEFGAQRIYQGQLAFTKSAKDKEIITHMLEQELEHLSYFESEVSNAKARPTFLLPVWSVLGYGLGAISAFMGPKSAMLVTEGVEEVIVNHYQEQIDYLQKADKTNPLLTKIKKFKQDEAEHIQIAADNESKQVLFHTALSKLIKGACQVAIFLSKRV